MGTKIKHLLGGGKRDRTADLLHAMQALSQLSYTPKKVAHYKGRAEQSKAKRTLRTPVLNANPYFACILSRELSMQQFAVFKPRI